MECLFILKGDMARMDIIKTCYKHFIAAGVWYNRPTGGRREEAHTLGLRKSNEMSLNGHQTAQ